MAQSSVKYVRPSTFCKSKAFRQGYEDYRNGKAARFGEWGADDAAYELGRQSAATLIAQGDVLRIIPVKTKISPNDLKWLVAACLDAQRRNVRGAA